MPRLRPIPWRHVPLALALAHAASAVGSGAAPAPEAEFLRTYCFECHRSAKAKGHLNLEALSGTFSPGRHSEPWERVIDVLTNAEMPPSDAEKQPPAAERARAADRLRAALAAYAAAHAGDPGPVTVRRLTSAELGYVVRDLTGIELKLGVDSSADAVGGEGFTNFGDVQFVQDATVERFLEAAKRVADHAMIGAGPLFFSPDPGATGLELSALRRINALYAERGFRVASGEGGRPFGLERYGKALFAAWVFQHRAVLGEPQVTLRDLAEREGITGRFAEHIWSVVNGTDLAHPAAEMVARWRTLPVPANRDAAAAQQARAGCDALAKHLTTWPSWLFGRGDLAAGGAGDESPLLFTDAALKAVPTHRYVHLLGRARGMRPIEPAADSSAAAAPVKVVLNVSNLTPGRSAVVIWRDARVVMRALPTRTRETASTAAATQPAVADPNLPVDPNAAAAAPTRGRGRLGPPVSSEPLRALLPADVRERLGFGESRDGTTLGPDDFATRETVAFELPPAKPGLMAFLEVQAELGAERDAVIRVVVADRETVPERGAQARVFLGDPASAGYRSFRSGIAQYVALLPPNSHGEANPADKDPVPEPFDNTYNSPEHDAFVMKVKYQRNDAFFTENMVDGPERQQLDEAWHDLLGSWPYHDAYLGMLVEHHGLKLSSRRIKELGTEELAALADEPRRQITALRASFEAVSAALTRAQPAHVENVIEFASRAWRRPVRAEEAERLRAFYRRLRQEERLEHESAIRALLARVLVAPEFLYRMEPAAAAERPLDAWELASRLSFFLWSSAPDDELRRAAGAGELLDPAKLAAQVRRMCADPKARRFATEFFGQWLGYYQFDQHRGADTSLFSDFTPEVQAAMHAEAVATFEYLVRAGRPVREVLHADFTFLNPTLAKFYGLEVALPPGDELVRVDGAAKLNRGGALRLGAILTATSAPLRTSPVKRGDWLLRRILDTPTPPPPADAGSLPSDPKAFGGQTLRQKLDEHKRNATCANCHLRIDPLGFPLEAFDAVGRVRATYEDGTPVELTGEFADKSTIVGPEGLLNFLRTREPQILQTLAKKMLGYALGRTVLASDRALIAELVAAGGDARVADLAAKIVASRQFRHRASADAHNAERQSN